MKTSPQDLFSDFNIMYLLDIEKADDVDVYYDSDNSDMTTRIYTIIFTVAFDMLINDVLFLIFHISIKIIGKIYAKPVTKIYLFNNT